MFNDKYGLTQAVLEGRKTQTRRTFLKPGEDPLLHGITPEYLISVRSRYSLGETIAIAQKYEDLRKDDEFYRLCGKNGMPLECIKYEKGCSNKMFVKADLMPHRIRITNIRIERLQDISDEDVIHEGFSNICFNKNMGNMLSEWCYDLCYYDAFGNSQSLHSTIAKEAYSYLIAKLYGWSLWDSNPYVFVYDFELVK